MSNPRLRELIYVALGQASMCWEAPEKAGEFQSEQASEIGDQLIRDLAEFKIGGDDE